MEYKVIAIPSSAMEDELNRLSQDGWRVVSAFQETGRVRPTVILERTRKGIARD